METRANYVLVGIFTVVAITAAFLFVYWTGRFGNTSENVPIEISIPGSAAGLDTGSRILFNGIRIGVVRNVSLDETNPGIAIAIGVVDRRAPIKPSTTATISVATLSGTAEVALTGGNPSEQNRLALLPNGEPEVIRIEASPSAFNDIVDSAQILLDRADVIFKGMEGILAEGQQPLINTVKNAEKISGILADSSGDISALVASIKSLSDTASGLSTRLEGTVDAAEKLIKAVDPEKVSTIVGNVELMSGKLERATDDISDIVADAGEAMAAVKAGAASAQAAISAINADRVNKILDDTQQLTTTANQTATKLDVLLGAVNAEKINKLVDDATQTAASIRKTAEGLSTTLDPDQLGRVLGSVEVFTGRLERASAEFDGIAIGVGELTDKANVIAGRADTMLQGAEKIVAAIKPDDVGRITQSITNAATEAENAAKSIAKAGDAAAELGKIVSGKTPAIENAIEQSSQLITRLNSASVRVDGILSKFDTLLGSGETTNLAGSITGTLDAYRALAFTLNARVNEIAGGLAQFSNNGLRDIQRLANESRSTLQRVERSVDSLARNPQRVITGGEGDVRRFDGTSERQRR